MQNESYLHIFYVSIPGNPSQNTASSSSQYSPDSRIGSSQTKQLVSLFVLTFLDFLFGGELLAWSFLLGFLPGVAIVIRQVKYLGQNGAEKQIPAKNHTTTHSKYLAFYGTVNFNVVDILPWYNSVFVKVVEMKFQTTPLSRSLAISQKLLFIFLLIFHI